MTALGIAVATAATFLISAAFYGAVPAAAAPSAPSRSPAVLAAVELARNAAGAGLVAGLLVAGDWRGAAAGALLGSALSVLPVVLLAGSVFHEGVPWTRAGLHAVDWTIKLIAMGVIIGLFL